jgi:hypothetical protein
MVKRAILALALCLTSAGETDHFIPPDLAQSSMLACGIGRNADGSVDAILGVSYVHEIKSQWRILMARESDPNAVDKAADDCIKWWEDMKKALHAVKRP